MSHLGALPRKQRYRMEGEKWIIEVHVRKALQLFDARDPAPFRERDLDDDFIRYIHAAAREFSMRTPLRIRVTVAEQGPEELTVDSIREAIQGYLAYELELEHMDLRSHLKRAFVVLMIGLLALFVSLGAAQSLPVPETPGALGILREGIVIFGWVAMWKPLDLILFDWLPLWDKIRLSRKLLETEIDVRFQG